MAAAISARHGETCLLRANCSPDFCAACRVGIRMPTVTVQYADLGVDATVHVGSRALPSVWNSYRNTLEVHAPACMLTSLLKRQIYTWTSPG